MREKIKPQSYRLNSPKFILYLGIMSLVFSLGYVYLNASKNSFSSFSTKDIQELHTFSKAIDFSDWKSKIDVLAKSPHPFGSKEQRLVAEWIVEQAKSSEATVLLQEFEALTPNPILMDNPKAPADLLIPKKGQNILAKLSTSNTDCFTVIGSHYDTKIIGKDPYHGANDSASSSYALLKLLEIHQKFRKLSSKHSTPKAACDFLFVWFDGEESVLDNWTSGEFEHPAQSKDNTYGSRFFVNQLKSCHQKFKCIEFPNQPPKKIHSLLLLDMIGSPNIMLSQDEFSDQTLWLRAKEISKLLSLKIKFSEQSIPVEDDHIPFVKAGIRSINLIDFNNVMHWHKPTDLVENLDPKSIEEIIHLSFILGLEMTH